MLEGEGKIAIETERNSHSSSLLLNPTPQAHIKERGGHTSPSKSNSPTVGLPSLRSCELSAALRDARTAELAVRGSAIVAVAARARREDIFGCGDWRWVVRGVGGERRELGEERGRGEGGGRRGLGWG